MPIFSYKVRDARGSESEGAVEAGNEAQATEVLRERGDQVLSMALREEPSVGNLRFTFLQRVTPKDVVVFSRQLSVMIGASVAIVRALRASARQTTNPKL